MRFCIVEMFQVPTKVLSSCADTFHQTPRALCLYTAAHTTFDKAAYTVSAAEGVLRTVCSWLHRAWLVYQVNVA